MGRVETDFASAGPCLPAGSVRGDLDAATHHLTLSRELGEHTELPQNPCRWQVAMARIRAIQGDPTAALDLLDQAVRLYVADFSPNVRPVPASRARLWVVLGRLDDAHDWALQQGLSVQDDPSYLREFEHITLVRVLLAQNRTGGVPSRLEEVIGFLERLLQAAEVGERIGSVIEILVLLALANQAHGDLPVALTSLERSLVLAEPEGYVRMMVDEGPAMTAMLKAVATGGTAVGYVRRLLGASTRPEEGTFVDMGLIDPLSERELQVLRLLGTDLGGPEIARELVVSLNTVRTHTKSIFTKLGVNNRRSAVRRAEDLTLLSRTRNRDVHAGETEGLRPGR
jgi:LuxR family transcriptional regulator, maltose regulon positive regulatory protein